MKNFLTFIGFLLFALFAAAVGHDFYLLYQAYQADNAIDLVKEFKATDLGWLWINYAPIGYDAAMGSMDPESWRAYVEPVLRMTTIILTGGMLVGYLAILFGLRLLGLPPYEGQGILLAGAARKAKGPKNLLDDSGKSFKYNRKR